MNFKSVCTQADISRNVIVVRNLKDAHCRTAVEEVDAHKTQDDEGGTAHKHQGELHGCILLATRTPVANQEVHRDKGNLVEHEHGEEVDGDKETIDTG